MTYSLANDIVPTWVLAAFFTIFILTVGLAYITAKQKLALAKEENRLGFMGLSINVKEIDESIEEFVEICLTEYLAYNPQLQTEVYINSTLEKEIVEEVTKLCVNRISPVLLDKFSLCYASNALGEVISRKVYMRVLIYQIDHEHAKKEEIERVNAQKENLPESP